MHWINGKNDAKKSAEKKPRNTVIWRFNFQRRQLANVLHIWATVARFVCNLLAPQIIYHCVCVNWKSEIWKSKSAKTVVRTICSTQEPLVPYQCLSYAYIITQPSSSIFYQLYAVCSHTKRSERELIHIFVCISYKESNRSFLRICCLFIYFNFVSFLMRLT